MTIPRELSIRDGRLIQSPVREIESLHEKKVHYENIAAGEEEVELSGVRGRVMDLNVTIRDDEETSCESFVLCFAKDNQHECRVIFSPENSVLTIDRSKAGFTQDFVHVRSCRVQKQSGRLNLRILLDRYSSEIFVNEGEQVLTMTYYSPGEADRITFEARGKAHIDVTAFTLRTGQKEILRRD